MRAKSKPASVGERASDDSARSRSAERWTPLHPMHIALTERLAPAPEAHIDHYPPTIRLAIALGLAAASWVFVWWFAVAVMHLLGA